MREAEIMVTYKALAHDHSSPFIHAGSYLTAACTLLKPILGVNNYSLITEFIGGSEWRFSSRFSGKEDEWQKLGERTLQLLKDKTFLDKIYDGEKRCCKELRDYSARLRKTDFKKYSNSELNQAYQKLFAIWCDMNAWGDVVNLADFDHFMLTERIMGFLDERCESSDLDISAGEAFGILGTPTERSFLQQEEFEIFKILSEIRSNPDSIVTFCGSLNEIMEKLPKQPKIDRMLEEHTEKFDWLQFHYEGPTILGRDYFVDMLRSELKQGFDGKKKINEILAHEKEIVERQKKLEKELKLSDDEKYWCRAARTFSYLKGLRKDIVFLASRNTDPLVREIARRMQLSPKQVRHMMPIEITEGLKKGDFDIDLLNERIAHCVFMADELGPRLLTGKEAEKIAGMIREEKVDENITEIKGTPAFPGFVRGMVKIIHKAEDMGKMNDGDILVSPATNPNIVPAMKKASAIVTDEGGVTCHAAIVSREMKIPCVIGTKIATKALKDGDKVEVDATKGVIRKIQ
ncbi:MAG: PEP-utilizing enzyme [Candidatus Micrarchaeota archaeon]